MILVHKPLPISSHTPAHYHRRMPSAPNVSVQPTRTPGLLSIIPKQQPQRSSQPQRSQPRMTPLKENQRQNRSPKPASTKAQPIVLQEVIKPPAVESDKPKSVKAQSKNPSSTPDKSSSGRTSQKRSPKDKATAERYYFPKYHLLILFGIYSRYPGVLPRRPLGKLVDRLANHLLQDSPPMLKLYHTSFPNLRRTHRRTFLTLS